MAAAAAMDVSDSQSEVNRLKGGPLAVSKSSGKIGKPMKKATAPARPADTMITADASEFRRVVQELTGTPPAAQQPMQPPASRPSRLHRIAPPPLRPSYSHPGLFQQQQPPAHMPSSQALQPNNPAAFASFHQASPNIPSLPTLSPHFFSPLPALTPGDNTWANPLETPAPPASAPAVHGNGTIYFPPHANIAGEGPGRRMDDGAAAPQTPPLLPTPGGRLPWSPGVIPWSPRLLPSPLPLSPNLLPPLSPSFLPPLSPGFFAHSGFPSPRSAAFGFGNIYNGMGPNGTAGVGSSQEFSFQWHNGSGAYRPS